MPETERPRRLPNPERLSVLSATILLAYAVARFIHLPIQEISLQLPGLYLEIQIGVPVFVAFLVAGLVATGTDWLMRDHPALEGQSTLQHWLLPMLTALAIEVPLFQLPLGYIWWLGFAAGGIFLILVLVAEYIVIDPEDARQPWAAMGLTAVSFALYLVLAAGLRFSGARLIITVPALTIAAWLVSLRTFNLQLHGQWLFVPASIVGLLTAQVTAALHYWPLSPVSFGLALLSPTYSLTSLFRNLAEGKKFSQAVIESAILLLVIWGMAWWIQ